MYTVYNKVFQSLSSKPTQSQVLCYKERKYSSMDLDQAQEWQKCLSNLLPIWLETVVGEERAISKSKPYLASTTKCAHR